MAPPFRYQRGEDITVLLAIIGNASPAAHVVAVSAAIKPAINLSFVPAASVAPAASFSVSAQLTPPAGGVAGWYLTLSAAQAAALGTGTFVTNAELVFDSGAIEVTDPLFFTIQESTAPVATGGAPAISWTQAPPSGGQPAGSLTLRWMGGGSNIGQVAIVIGPQGLQGTSGAEPQFGFTAGGTISGQCAVYVGDDGLLYPCQTDITARRCIGLTTGAVAQGEPATVQIGGGYTEPSWAWAGTSPVWIGANGSLSQTPPASGALAIIGIPLGPTMLRIAPQFIALT